MRMMIPVVPGKVCELVYAADPSEFLPRDMGHAAQAVEVAQGLAEQNERTVQVARYASMRHKFLQTHAAHRPDEQRGRMASQLAAFFSSSCSSSASSLPSTGIDRSELSGFFNALRELSGMTIHNGYYIWFHRDRNSDPPGVIKHNITMKVEGPYIHSEDRNLLVVMFKDETNEIGSAAHLQNIGYIKTCLAERGFMFGWIMYPDRTELYTLDHQGDDIQQIFATSNDNVLDILEAFEAQRIV